MMKSSPDEKEQRELLVSLKDGGGYGLLCILKGRGDVVFAASPVPGLIGYEVVCASPERTYDIWKDGLLIQPGQTREQIKTWIKNNTPVWLYDDSISTDEQKTKVKEWIDAFLRKYPGTLTLG